MGESESRALGGLHIVREADHQGVALPCGHVSELFDGADPLISQRNRGIAVEFNPLCCSVTDVGKLDVERTAPVVQT